MKNLLVILLVGLITLSGCQKEESKHPCYDRSIVHNDFCQTDCPGITGCDGEVYCNECEAARKGIRKK